MSGECVQAFVIAHDSGVEIELVETTEHTLRGVQLVGRSHPSPKLEKFVGSDDVSNRVCFEVEYTEHGSVYEVDTLYGHWEESYGRPTEVNI